MILAYDFGYFTVILRSCKCSFGIVISIAFILSGLSVIEVYSHSCVELLLVLKKAFFYEKVWTY